MICVYPADCTDFSTNGNGTLAPLSAEVTETLNGEYELTLVHPIDEAGKWQRLVEGCIYLSVPLPCLWSAMFLLRRSMAMFIIFSFFRTLLH